MNKDIIIDFHCHTALRAANRGLENIKIGYQIMKFLPKDSIVDEYNGSFINFAQSDIKNIDEGNVGIAFTAIYGLEAGIVELAKYSLAEEIDDNTDLDDLKDKINPKIFKLLKIFNGIDKDLANFLALNYMLGLNTAKVKQLTNEPYFKSFKREYDLLTHFNDIKAVVNYNHVWMKTASDFNDIHAAISFNQDPKNKKRRRKHIVNIITVEGIQTFSSETRENSLSGNFQTSDIIANIRRVKNDMEIFEYPLFVVTFCHFFDNGLVGQARALPDVFNKLLKGMLGGKMPTKQINNGITTDGKRVIEELLDVDFNAKKRKGEGRRILVDTKHMSAQSRIEFYKWVLDYNQNTVTYYRNESGDNERDFIPIISSHSAFSGVEEIQGSEVYDKDNSACPNKHFNCWSINLSKEEVRIIHKTRGLIGLNFDERILTGDYTLNAENNPNSIYKQLEGKDISEKRKIWLRQFRDNIFEMVKSVVDDINSDETGIWSRFVIGTDFDGIINPMDTFFSGTEFQFFRETFIGVLNEYSQAEKEKYFLGLSKEDIAKKIMHQNALDFLEIHFWDKVDRIVNQNVS